MNLTAWILLGAIIGVLGFLLESKRGGSLIGAVLLGIIGAIVGGTFANLVFGMGEVSGFSIITLSTVVLGSLLLIVSSKALRRIPR